MMSTPDTRSNLWSAQGLRRLATSFVAQEHVGVFGGLLLRLARFLQGDPSSPVTMTATAGQSQGLPDDVRALSAVLTVTGQPIVYRLDGQAPTAADALLAVGTVITLTGQPSIKGFRFTTATASAATLTGSYFD